jgi:hypothetical protein
MFRKSDNDKNGSTVRNARESKLSALLAGISNCFLIKIIPSLISYWGYFRHYDGSIILLGFGYHTADKFRKYTNAITFYFCLFNFNFSLLIRGYPPTEKKPYSFHHFEWYRQIKIKKAVKVLSLDQLCRSQPC